MKAYDGKLALWAILLLALMLATPTSTSAAVPSVMNFQAILLDDQGQIVTDSSYDIVFTIHPDSVSFSVDIILWTELKTVQTSGGLFNTMLGSISPLTAEVFDGDRWLQMRLASSTQPFLPRTRIGTTPYSYRVESIDKSSGGEVSGMLNPDTVQIGRSGMPGDLSVMRGNGIAGLLSGDYTGYGNQLRIYDEAGNPYFSIQPDADDAGGYLSIRRSATSTGLRVDGNFNGTQEPKVMVLGSSQSATFDMSNSGSGSVTLPVDAIEGSEMLDEPGVASNLSTAMLSVGSARTNLLSRTIVAPADGFILAIGTVEVRFSSDSAIVWIGLTNDYTVWPTSQQFMTTLRKSTPYDDAKTVTVSAIFPVVAGADVIYLVASCHAPGPTIPKAHNRYLSLLYVPTSYGTVSPPTASETVDAADFSEERLASLRVNSERIEREMAEMKARLSELERSMTEQESDNLQR